MDNTIITVALRGFSFTNIPSTTPLTWYKEPEYHNTTVSFRVFSQFRRGRK